MKRASATAKWKTKSGQTVLIREMETSHIKNTLALLERTFMARMTAVALSAWRYAETAPDGASMAADDAAEEAMESMDTLEGIEREFPVYSELVAELEYREKQS